jgi:hypothetical protein
VLHRNLGQLGEIARAKQPIRLPVVLTRDEVQALLTRLSDVPRVAVLPDSVAPVLRAHLASVRGQQARDLAAGAGRVMLPFAYDRKSPHAAKEWGWQFVFPAGRPAPRRGGTSFT